MISLRLYYLWFFIICLVLTLLTGVLAAFLPNSIGGILTAMPYLIAIILVLFKFLRQQRRAPTAQEQKQFTLVFSFIFWGYNLIGLMAGLYFFSRRDPQVWQNFLLYLQEPKFLLTVLAMWLMLAIPLYLITYWFYGKQAQRMAAKMFA
ncbi:ABZJ_00895 family protein [Acinetobacter haemolyticus]|uniref:Uncharacterized protein n=1 Tax=Acinetobacter haemolyticus TaxID=29430 RepID=A0A514TKH1_ACIHA|nr:ABZJ_00895 family protein [Acinetobacter haemolyticus]ENW19178.1 hypothetical protein F926_02739 [Acinetobacter haemolyticus NIPH 261]MEB6676210.1 ABZJ_00895 family protein [Acinetobacter haemolyticus]NAR49433.1 hypothetical protein [Acinetobacter haemolyticus]NAR56923.1 hypothetical protein [Acinetobacter haemolyticus]NAR67565.1 hypothetical protein [Acinetobacter haemolyticus]